MLVFGSSLTPPATYNIYFMMVCRKHEQIAVAGINGDMNINRSEDRSACAGPRARMAPLATAALVAATASALIMSALEAGAVELGVQQRQQQQQEAETLSNIPQVLSGRCLSGQQDCKKARIQRPKSRKAELCTIKCVTTCIQGGFGSPGEGPLSLRRPLVVFKKGFHSRRYCLAECSDICNLIGDGNDGP